MIHLELELFHVKFQIISFRSFKQKSHESVERKSSDRRTLESFLPRRRFSQGIIEPLKGMLTEISDESDKPQETLNDNSVQIEQKVTQEKKTKELRSLTGANASGWKFKSSEYGNFCSGKRMALDTAWGRRIYDQYEMEVEVEKPKATYLTSKPVESKKGFALTKKNELRDLGVWDVIYNGEVVLDLKAAKNWEADHEEMQKAIEKLNVDIEKLQEEVVITDTEDPVNKFKIKFFKVRASITYILQIFYCIFYYILFRLVPT